MAPAPVECVVRRDISRDFDDRLLVEVGESPGTRLTYDQGLVQIIVVSPAHDCPNRLLAGLVQAVADELGIDSPLYPRRAAARSVEGFEPDSCFYFQYAEGMRGEDEIDLMVDPAPELVIEVDITSHSLNWLTIFAAVGVREVWRYADGAVAMYGLREGQYVSIAGSLALPVLTPATVTELLVAARRLPRPVWVRQLRDFVPGRWAKPSYFARSAVPS